jgi:hypothetical protein
MNESPEDTSLVSQLIGLIKDQNAVASQQRDAQLLAITAGFSDIRGEIHGAVRYAAIMGVVTIMAVVVLAGGSIYLKTGKSELNTGSHIDVLPPLHGPVEEGDFPVTTGD